ncbi:MAG: ABC transporter substrate-binding protein [Gloeocapsa sp. UFS-A4-WI-NPMV-4B04]|nr:ABC transporter substrate-binding protein [Gloeocapsa sp. UFS-A4-WI-NPMV-4B04]
MWIRNLLVLSCISFVLASCGSTTSTDTASSSQPFGGTTAQPLTPVKVGHLVALDMAPLFVGVESGCFKQNGLAVETVAFTNPGDNNAALAGSAIDFNINPFTLPFFAASSGVPIKTISAAGGWGVMQVIAKSQYKIKSAEGLARYVKDNPGKKLKIATLRGDTLELILLDTFEKEDLSVNDFEMVYFDDLLAMVDAFKLDKVDMLSHIKPYTTQFVENGSATVVTDNAKIWSPNTPNTVVSVLDKTLTGRPQVVESYLKGMQCAAKIINENPQEAISLLKGGNYYRVDDKVLLKAFETQPAPITFTPDLKAVQGVVDEMVKLKYIKVDVPASKIFDVSIIEKLEK